MTKTQIAIGAALLAGILSTPLIIQQQALATARAEQSELQARLRDLPAQPVQPARQVPGTIDIAARDRADLARLRLEVPALRSKIAEFSAQAQQVAAASPWHKPGGIALGDVLRLRDARDAGQATPAATIQTMMWAMLQGDTNRITQLVVVEDGADVERVKKTLDELAHKADGLRSDDHAAEIEKVEQLLLEEQPGQNDDRWMVSQAMQEPVSRVLFRQTDTGWRLVIGTNGVPVGEPITDQP